ncbi:MAG: glyoxalase [Conexibacter sp.]|nr:glyoxalase [Conexibacter sp.]MCZ4493393.1 glyoxalase [Conexibacter sp.]MDX6716493.1 glyoxylase family protein [Baekduia sp.]MDX6732534.1 glyoxylase family protein [Baekduia sp.]
MTDVPPSADPTTPVAPEAVPEAPAEARRMQLLGLHHVSAIVADLDRTTAFYRDVLGLALVEQGDNSDDPGSRHFWFGDAAGTPGSLVSFMEYPTMDEAVEGRGGVHHFAFRVGSADEQAAWRDYLRARDVPCSEVFERGRFASIYFRDPDGHLLEIATG